MSQAGEHLLLCAVVTRMLLKAALLGRGGGLICKGACCLSIKTWFQSPGKSQAWSHTCVAARGRQGYPSGLLVISDRPGLKKIRERVKEIPMPTICLCTIMYVHTPYMRVHVPHTHTRMHTPKV